MPKTSYITSHGMIWGEISESNSVTSYGHDALGSVTETFSNGALQNTYRYTPYGATLAKSGTAPDPRFLWNGGTGFRTIQTAYLSFYHSGSHYAVSSSIWTSVNPLWPASSSISAFESSPVSRLASGVTGSRGNVGWVSCYTDSGCGACGSGGVTPISKGVCKAPFCCRRHIYYSDEVHAYGAKKAKPLVNVLNCFDQVSITLMAWDRRNQIWVATSHNTIVTIVDTGRLTPSQGQYAGQDTEPGPDGRRYERIVDVLPGPSRSLGNSGSCDAFLRIAKFQIVGNAFPQGNICWSNHCQKGVQNRPQSQCATKDRNSNDPNCIEDK